MWATRQVLTAGLFVAAASSARAELTYTETPKIYTESPRTGAIELRLGGYKPLIDREKSLNSRVYDQAFGASAMFLIELEVQKFFYQGIGTAGVGGASRPQCPAGTVPGDY